MKKNNKINSKKILIVSIVILIISFAVPVRKANEIVYKHDFDDGGRTVVCYYNMYGIKIRTIKK